MPPFISMLVPSQSPFADDAEVATGNRPGLKREGRHGARAVSDNGYAGGRTGNLGILAFDRDGGVGGVA